MYLLSEVREVTSCSTSKPARSFVMRTTAARAPAPQSANFVGFNWVLAREGREHGMGSKRVWRQSILPCNPPAIAGGC